MKHTCDKCQTRYEIPDARVRGRFLKVRCKICQNTMRVVGIETVESRSGAVWWCAIQGKAQGPLREDEVLARIDIGDLHARTRMWCEGMTAWERGVGGLWRTSQEHPAVVIYCNVFDMYACTNKM